ncbi:MAG: hypothetical protein RBR77_14015 [Thauera sp.]|jgi:hypothetical protein|nr:hypothetical protein [Thauera sp.]
MSGYELNDLHPLAPYVVELIGVKDGALTSTVEDRAFTLDAGTSFGNGALGGHFRSLKNSYSGRAALIDPPVKMRIGDRPSSVMLITNYFDRSGLGSPNLALGGTTGQAYVMGLNSTGVITTPAWGAEVHSSVDATEPMTLCVAWTGSPEKVATIILNGEQLATRDGDFTYGVDAYYNAIGARPGHGSVTADFVWVVFFQKTLSPAEVQGLISTLGPNNAFGLVKGVQRGRSNPLFLTPF